MIGVPECVSDIDIMMFNFLEEEGVKQIDEYPIDNTEQSVTFNGDTLTVDNFKQGYRTVYSSYEDTISEYASIVFNNNKRAYDEELDRLFALAD